MKKKIDYGAEMDKARQAVAGLDRNGDPETLEAYWEVCCGDVLIAEENLRNQQRSWENAALVREFLDIATYLEGYDSMLDNLYSAVSRMKETIFSHPRLKLELLEFEQLVLQRIEALHDQELGECEEVQEEILFYQRNIDRAERGDFDRIDRIGHLKQDPIEWSADFERVIDEVDRKADALLEEYPRGMGFCFAFWSTRAKILREEYGIEWRTPYMMDPGVMFD